jgi:hypothetical protein
MYNRKHFFLQNIPHQQCCVKEQYRGKKNFQLQIQCWTKINIKLLFSLNEARLTRSRNVNSQNNKCWCYVEQYTLTGRTEGQLSREAVNISRQGFCCMLKKIFL